MENDYKTNHIVGITTIVVALTIVSTLLLATAMLLWLAEAMGSLIGALLAVGGATTLVAILLYHGSVRPFFGRLRSEIATIYELSRLAGLGYEWIKKIFL